MSILGSGSLPPVGIAASAAASQQRAPELVDRDKLDQAIQKFQADEVRLNERDLDDSIETEFSHGQVGDRDSDGRLPWQQQTGPGNSGPPAESPVDDPSSRTNSSTDGCGQVLDVDA